MPEPASPKRALPRRTPGQNASALFVGQALSRLLALGFYVALARLLGPASIGDFAVGVAFGTLASFALEPGLNPQLIREGARDMSLRREYASQICLYKIVAAPVMIALITASAALLGYRENGLLAIGFAGGAVILGQLDDFAAAALTACERLDISALLRLLNKLATAVPAAGVALLGGSFAAVCIAYFIGALLSALVAIGVVHLRFVRLTPTPGQQPLRHKIRSGLPLALSSGLWLISLRIDQVMASLFGVPSAAIGGYNNAIKLKEALIMVPAVFAASFTPALARQADDPVAMRHSFHLAVHWGLGGAIPVAVGTWVVANALLGAIFGQAFAAYGDIMRWLFVAYAGNSLITLLNALVVARHRYNQQAISSASLLLVNVALNAILLPTLGMRGAAIATAVSTGVGALVLAREVVRAHCLRPLLLALARSLGCALPMAAVATWLLPIHLVLAIVGGALIYVPLYVAVGGAGKPLRMLLRGSHGRT